jgi:prolyl oligopeptidase
VSSIRHDADGKSDKVFYYENIEGGHGGAADNKQQAYMNTMYLNFLKDVLHAK